MQYRAAHNTTTRCVGVYQATVCVRTGIEGVWASILFVTGGRDLEGVVVQGLEGVVVKGGAEESAGCHAAVATVNEQGRRRRIAAAAYERFLFVTIAYRL